VAGMATVMKASETLAMAKRHRCSIRLPHKQGSGKLVTSFDNWGMHPSQRMVQTAATPPLWQSFHGSWCICTPAYHKTMDGANTLWQIWKAAASSRHHN
jgi:hypothetical protein